MRYKKAIAAASIMLLLTACGDTGQSRVSDAYKKSSEKPPVTAQAESSAETSLVEVTEKISEKTTAAAEETLTEKPEESAVSESFDTFYGILIDEDCSDVSDPPLHDLPCMLMEECRASGFGIDIQQEDGTWVFYMFGQKGQDLAWEYLLQTEREDNLYVTVEGTWEDNEIKVISLTES